MYGYRKQVGHTRVTNWERGKVSFAKFADIHEINYLITDSAAQKIVINRIGN